ncbi:DUF2752 domain-containing protein [Arenimonas composti]|nr:DUF2752 domain-containing protein [Arenimonas composti]
MAAARRMLWMAPAGGFVAAGVWALRTWDPNLPGNPFLGCVFYAATGLHCPGCGATRALHALVHFDLAGALAMNALLILGGPLGLLLVLRALQQLPASFEPWLRPLARPWLWVGLVAGFGVLRNLPWAPFSWLAPG